VENLRAECGEAPFEHFRQAYPGLESIGYQLASVDLERISTEADVVLVHEWNDPLLVNEWGRLRKARGGFQLFFHDTHHRLVTSPEALDRFDLSGYDGVLAYGRILRDLYLRTGRVRRAWTWHEAADVRVFKPMRSQPLEGDLVWIGNWGDEERSEELHEFLIDPVKRLGLQARVYGVRYPESARQALAEAGIEYAGWLPNFQVPAVFGRFRFTVHIPRRPYAKALPGIPTIRVFETLACGIPMISAPWDDDEHLFTPGRDFLLARTGKEMKRLLSRLLEDSDQGEAMATQGLETIRRRHTCAHRVNELLRIVAAARNLDGGANTLGYEQRT
jgi:spore maturation protein CgeB